MAVAPGTTGDALGGVHYIGDVDDDDDTTTTVTVHYPDRLLQP